MGGRAALFREREDAVMRKRRQIMSDDVLKGRSLLRYGKRVLAPGVGLEPTTYGLTVHRSAN